jgi:3'-phosphoadenosine 5'-phosphosulfate (PAPS) 3'-phosphatase
VCILILVSEAMLVLLSLLALLAVPASSLNVFKHQTGMRSMTQLSNSVTHSTEFYRFKKDLNEMDVSFSVEELEELQKLITSSLTNKLKLQSEKHSLQDLCSISKEACMIVTPMLKAFYAKMHADEPGQGSEYFEDRTAKLKADATYFSIADGIVQHMFIDFLFAGNKFAQIVGEEDETVVNLLQRPYSVDDLIVPEEFNGLVEVTLAKIQALASKIDQNAFKKLTVFVDPIDGTREFATGKGDAVSILIGYNDQFGKPVAGIVYRPLTIPVTWAAGAESENCIMGNLDYAKVPNPRGMLVTDGKVSNFMVRLITELGYEKVPSLASGNRALMLLEGKAGAYIRDTGGFAKWDTSGPQAVIDAYGGTMSKLPPFLVDKSLECYTHLKTKENLDFIPGKVKLTLSNARVKSQVPKDETVTTIDGMTTITTTTKREVVVSEVEMVREYSCLQGLVALNKAGLENTEIIHAAMMKVINSEAPTYN